VWQHDLICYCWRFACIEIAEHRRAVAPCGSPGLSSRGAERPAPEWERQAPGWQQRYVAS
jgi:hypothetical protein